MQRILAEVFKMDLSESGWLWFLPNSVLGSFTFFLVIWILYLNRIWMKFGVFFYLLQWRPKTLWCSSLGFWVYVRQTVIAKAVNWSLQLQVVESKLWWSMSIKESGEAGIFPYKARVFLLPLNMHFVSFLICLVHQSGLSFWLLSSSDYIYLLRNHHFLLLHYKLYVVGLK